jgi:hypothetical protein
MRNRTDAPLILFQILTWIAFSAEAFQFGPAIVSSSASAAALRLTATQRNDDDDLILKKFDTKTNYQRRRGVNVGYVVERRQSDTEFQNWGLRRESPSPTFPSDTDSLINTVMDSIVGTISGTQINDPNIVQNALKGDTLFGRRPVRNTWDAGRIGIELDGVKSLFVERPTEASALRRVALILASRLSVEKWKGNSIRQPVPVTVYVNTIKQALMASNELRLLTRSAHLASSFSCITIACLGQDDLMPTALHRSSNQIVPLNPRRGIIIVVQPTDFNAEYKPPAPAAGCLKSLQRLAARATVEGMPVVLISPRFRSMESPFATNWEQSGYQKSSPYGGMEPPRGPTPWIMRDFTPPVLCWINASSQQQRSILDPSGSRSSQISLLQSVMHESHAWHVFSKSDRGPRSEYEYLASTSSSAGRPTRKLLASIYDKLSSSY